MNPLARYATDDLKLVYRVLHAHLLDHVELVDSAFFHSLQSHLQALARTDGVDLSDHARWDDWLGREEARPDDDRARSRRTLQ